MNVYLRHPVEKVWASLTEPEKLAHWLEILSVFEFTWGSDVVRFELLPEADGCLLVLQQMFDVLDEQKPKELAGWHVHIDILLHLLADAMAEPFAEDELQQLLQ